MRAAKISELKAKLNANIQYVKNGEEVLILDRNAPVARLAPAGPIEDEDARMQRLIAKGAIPPAKDPDSRAGFKPIPAGNHPISQEVMDQFWEEERADRC
jgi:antitoxin (DNA-binding transcriptional repressor) of toxin-antitoxin stability system